MDLVRDLRGQRVYLDANIFIYALNSLEPYRVALLELFAAIDAGEIHSATSELTVAEVLVVPLRRANSDEERNCRMILRPRPSLELIPVSLGILEAAARLRASTPSLRMPDAIHLATAQQAGCQAALTNDERWKAVAPPKVILLSEAIQS